MGSLPGRKVVITLGSAKIRGISKHDITFDSKSIDCTEYDPDNDWAKNDVGMSSAKLTMSGFFRADDVAQSSLRAHAFAKDIIQDIKIYHDYAGGHYYAPDTAKDPEAGFRISQMKTGATVSGMVTIDFTFDSYGPVLEV